MKVQIYYSRVVNGKRFIEKIILTENKKKMNISYSSFLNLGLSFYSTTNVKNDSYKKRIETYK